MSYLNVSHTLMKYDTILGGLFIKTRVADVSVGLSVNTQTKYC